MLTAELHFANGIVARKDAVLTADLTDDVATELTAVPIRTGRPQKPLAAKDLAGAFTADGKALKVAAVEREPPQVFIVRADGVESEVLEKNLVRDRWQRYGAFPDSETHFHLVANAPVTYLDRGVKNEVFVASPDEVLYRANFEALLRAERFRPELPGNPQQPPPKQLFDATALAGLLAYSRQAPRAVVLIVKGDSADSSKLDRAAVRSYLAALGVPLFVWSLDDPRHIDRAWGQVDDISTSRALYAAYQRLQKEI